MEGYKIKFTATEIKHFFECNAEQSKRINKLKLKGFKWGVVAEDLYKRCLTDSGDLFYLVQSKIKEILPDFLPSQSVVLINNLINLIEEMKANAGNTLEKANVKVENAQFIAQIDFLMRTRDGFYFPREFKSYPSPGLYPYNSDIMQLTVQNLLLSEKYKGRYYYGEIAYLGSGKILGVNTLPYVRAISYASQLLQQGIKRINCDTCNFLYIPCYNQVRN